MLVLCMYTTSDDLLFITHFSNGLTSIFVCVRVYTIQSCKTVLYSGERVSHFIVSFKLLNFSFILTTCQPYYIPISQALCRRRRCRHNRAARPRAALRIAAAHSVCMYVFVRNTYAVDVLVSIIHATFFFSFVLVCSPPKVKYVTISVLLFCIIFK